VTGAMPQALQEKPNVTEDIRFYLRCFFILSKFRPASGFGISPILFSDVVTLARNVGFSDEDDLLWFSEFMADLDSEYREVMEEVRKVKTAQSKNSGSTNIGKARRATR